MPAGFAFEKLLGSLPARSMERRLVRCVPVLSYMKGSPPTFLYTSGRPNRCNPAGVECIYFSESEDAALGEYRAIHAGSPSASAPRLTYFAEVDLRRVVDLSKQEVLDLLGLSKLDLSAPWRVAPGPTKLQQLGLAVSRQTRISAIRYPAQAEKADGGWNVVIFRSSIASPNRVRILGNSGESLEELP